MISDTSVVTSEDEKLQTFYRNYLEQVFRLQPVCATALGDHRYDALLDDISAGARECWTNLIEGTLNELPGEIDYTGLSRDGQIDFEILRNNLISKLWVEKNLRPFETDPRTYGFYINDSVYLLLTKSTQPKEINVANAIARMAEIPRIISEATRSLRNPIKQVLETAIRQNAGAIRFYEREIFDYVGEGSRSDELQAAAAGGITELRSYHMFLEGLMLKIASNPWRLGRKKFQAKFELETGVAITAAENCAEAEKELVRVHDTLFNLCRELWPVYFPEQPLPLENSANRCDVIGKVTKAVSQDHGAGEDVLPTIKAAVDSIIGFICNKAFLPLPMPDRCSIIEMPEFKRGEAIAYFDGAPPLDPLAASFYAISPPPEEWPHELKQSFLEEYNNHMLKILTIHEAYPGHYVQFEYANKEPSLIRRIISCGSYIEGWAVYAETAMLDAGYGDGDLRLRLMQMKFYLRAVANAILDYKMHCTEMSDEEAFVFLVRDAFQSESEARLKIARAKQSSVQLSTYFVGRRAHCGLRQAMERELGDKFQLSRYHEAVLSI